MSLRRLARGVGRRAKAALGQALGRFRRPATVKGHGGAVLRVGMQVRSFHYPDDTPKTITKILRGGKEIELDFGDGVRDVMFADLYVPARPQRRRRR